MGRDESKAIAVFFQIYKAKRPTISGGAFCFVRSLTMTYFHIRMYTIIGAKSFHCPVRDGKEWGQIAMVVRHNCRLIGYGLRYSTCHKLEEVKGF